MRGEGGGGGEVIILLHDTQTKINTKKGFQRKKKNNNMRRQKCAQARESPSKQAHSSEREETEHKTADVTNSTRICVICINGCSGATAVRERMQISWLCKTARTKSGNNDDKPSGKWTHRVQQEITARPFPPSLCLHDKSRSKYFEDN